MAQLLQDAILAFFHEGDIEAGRALVVKTSETNGVAMFIQHTNGLEKLRNIWINQTVLILNGPVSAFHRVVLDIVFNIHRVEKYRSEIADSKLLGVFVSILMTATQTIDLQDRSVQRK